TRLALTALALSFDVVTEPFFSCAVPTDPAARAAYAGGASAATSAREETSRAAEGRRRGEDSDMTDSRWMRGRAIRGSNRRYACGTVGTSPAVDDKEPLRSSVLG